MSITTDLVSPRIPLKTSAWYSAKLLDRLGAAIPASALTTLKLTLYAPDFVGVTPAFNIINSRSEQNVLNANQCTLDSSGNFVWAMTPLDTVMLSSGAYERHIALFEWVGPDVGTGKHEAVFMIERLAQVE